ERGAPPSERPVPPSEGLPGRRLVGTTCMTRNVRVSNFRRTGRLDRGLVAWNRNPVRRAHDGDRQQTRAILPTLQWDSRKAAVRVRSALNRALTGEPAARTPVYVRAQSPHPREIIRDCRKASRTRSPRAASCGRDARPRGRATALQAHFNLGVAS